LKESPRQCLQADTDVPSWSGQSGTLWSHDISATWAQGEPILVCISCCYILLLDHLLQLQYLNLIFRTYPTLHHIRWVLTNLKHPDSIASTFQI
jgi:hypothetical protein